MLLKKIFAKSKHFLRAIVQVGQFKIFDARLCGPELEIAQAVVDIRVVFAIRPIAALQNLVKPRQTGAIKMMHGQCVIKQHKVQRTSSDFALPAVFAFVTTG